MIISYLTSVDPREVGGPASHVTGAVNALATTHDVSLFHARHQLFSRKVATVSCETSSAFFPLRRGGWRYFERMMASEIRKREKRADQVLYLRTSPSLCIAKALKHTKKFVVIELCGLEGAKHPALATTLQAADLVLVGTTSTKLALLKQSPNLGGKVTTHSNVGINLAMFKAEDPCAAKHKMGFSKDCKVLLHISGFQSHHDFQTLLTAFKMLYPQRLAARLILVGDGPRRPEVKSMVEALGLTDAVMLFGKISPEGLSELVAASDVCLNPMTLAKLLHGNLNALKTYEYIAGNRPVIESCAYSEPVPDWAQENLCCIAAEDPVALYLAMESILQDPSSWLNRTQRARSHVLENFSWNAVVNHTVTLIQEAMEASRRPS